MSHFTHAQPIQCLFLTALSRTKPNLNHSTRCTATFSTTSTQAKAATGSQVQRAQQGQKGQKRLVLKKKKKNAVAGPRPPAPGERKAARKRIVVSNTNAIPVPGLREVSHTGMAHADCEGEMMAMSGAAIDSLRAVEAFKTTQGWSLFSRPATVWRKETIELAGLMDSIQSGGEKTSRKLLLGAKNSGKSVLQLQAMAMAFAKGWVVISIPEARDVVLAATAYEPMEDTDRVKYIQNHYMAKLLQQTCKANSSVLASLLVSAKHNIPVQADNNTTLLQLAQFGANTPELAWPAFQALWSELMSQPAGDKGRRPPVLLALDGIHHIMRDSLYRSADFEPIHAHDLAIVDFFVQHLSGKKALANGGLVLAAVSQSDRVASDSLDFAIDVAEHAQRPSMFHEAPTWSPYLPLDQRVMDAVRGVEVVRLGGLTDVEARGIIKYYAASGILRQPVTDLLVAEKRALSSGGIVGELERNSILYRM